ncbi:MAG TPA: NAD(+)/NADH kinase [Chthoniobacterales bacterium]|jgi:NAD+ kinase|nr:NAD(+)/NADH kinase [Chthoniobacterales bacterium]
MRPKKIGLVAHTGKRGVAELTRTVQGELQRAGLEVLIEKETATLAGLPSGRSIPDLGREADLLVVLGGDGTILHLVGQLEENIKPVFGINIGALGFLTCANSSAYAEAVQCIAEGKMVFSERTLLDVQIAGAEDRGRMTGLNDVVFSRGEVSRLVRLKTSVNGEALTEFNADGLIVATPTGSTAYSLSAGGPILAPDSGALVITPICPHVLTNRSIIVDEDAVVEIEVTEDEYPVFLTVDGRGPVQMERGARVVIKKSERVLPLAALPGVSFFGVVRQKLKWSGSNI